MPKSKAYEYLEGFMHYLLRIFSRTFSLTTLLVFSVLAAATVAYQRFNLDLPDYRKLETYQTPVMSRIYADDGTLAAEYARERRLYLPITLIPKVVIAAFLSAEDRNFFHHIGIDAEGITRASINNFENGRLQGASTITQQVAKNFLLTSERSYSRKIKELLIAFRLENALTKEKILELYLNEIFLGTLLSGRNLYGVGAAALEYFDKPINQLTISEAAFLGGLPKAPNNYNPYKQYGKAVERRNMIIDLMEENRYITRAESEQAKKEPLVIRPHKLAPATVDANYFNEEVRRLLVERYGENALYEGGLTIRSTLNMDMQRAARKALSRGLIRYDRQRGWRGPVDHIVLNDNDWGSQLSTYPVLHDLQGWRLGIVLKISQERAVIGLQPKYDTNGSLSAEREQVTLTNRGVQWTHRRIPSLLKVGDVIFISQDQDGYDRVELMQFPKVSGGFVAMDPHNGRVHALVGGMSFDQSQFNRATQALRQPGSSFKPFVYAAALENGFTPSTIIDDAPISIPVSDTNRIWTPSNYGHHFSGPQTLRYGLEHSKNIMTVRIAKELGMDKIVECSRRFNVYDDMLPLLPMSLGAGETTLMRLVSAYSIFDNNGKRIFPKLVDRIQDRNGKTIYRQDETECLGCYAKNNQSPPLPEPILIDHSEQVIDPLTAYQMVSLLQGVVQRGTAVRLRVLNRPFAGKTGTTNDSKDVWFIGFSPDLAIGVYIGYDQPRSLGKAMTGSNLAIPVALDFLKVVLKDRPITNFTAPSGIQLIPIQRHLGIPSSERGSGTIIEAYKPGTGPMFADFRARAMRASRQSYAMKERELSVWEE